MTSLVVAACQHLDLVQSPGNPGHMDLWLLASSNDFSSREGAEHFAWWYFKALTNDDTLHNNNDTIHAFLSCISYYLGLYMQIVGMCARRGRKHPVTQSGQCRVVRCAVDPCSRVHARRQCAHWTLEIIRNHNKNTLHILKALYNKEALHAKHCIISNVTRHIPFAHKARHNTKLHINHTKKQGICAEFPHFAFRII